MDTDGVAANAEVVKNVAKNVMQMGTAQSSPNNGDNAHNLIPKDGTRSMYPMGQLDVQERLDEIDFETFIFEDGQFYAESDCDKDNPSVWNRDEAVEQEITIVFSTNKGGFFIGKCSFNEGCAR